MNYNFSKVFDKKLVTKDFVESKVSHEQLYERYLGISGGLNLKKAYRSPFNRDSSPSLRFIVKDNTLLWKCFSSNKSGDVYSLIGELYSVDSFTEILLKIATDFGLIPFIQAGDFKRITPLNTQYIETLPADIKVVVRDFNEEDLAYWLQYEITKADLDFFNVKAVQESWLNGRLYRKHQAGNPHFRYLNKNKYKLYWPLEKDKQRKWLCNTNADSVFNADKLDFNLDLCVITSSMKDVIVMYKMGYINCICANSETTLFSKKIMDFLKLKFPRIITLLNNDKAGIAAMEKYKELYGVDMFVIGDFFAEKDPSDFLKVYDKDFSTDYFHHYIKPPKLINV